MGRHWLHQAQNVLAGIRIEAVIYNRIGVLRRSTLYRWIAYTHLAVPADAQLAAHLQRNPHKTLTRAHTPLPLHIFAPGSAAVCTVQRQCRGIDSLLARHVYFAPRAFMKHLIRVLFAVFWRMGGPGLLALGILDSSFLFAPLGNDLLVVALASHYHSVLRVLYYAVMSTIGSLLGCLLVDVVLRRAGEKGLEKHLPPRRLAYVKNKVSRSAASALVIASLAPPPFPFTPFVMAAAALQYPRKRMLVVIGASRMVRFTSLGILAFFYGARILKWAEAPAVQGFLVGLIVLSTVGSAISGYGWIKRSRGVR